MFYISVLHDERPEPLIAGGLGEKVQRFGF
jgi:hypothetical protein